MRLRDLVAMPGLRLRFVLGENLDREIEWVHSTDLADPSAYLSGGELILTGGLWHDGPAAAERFVRALAQANVHGLGYGVRSSGAAVPSDVVVACRRNGLPLIEVPYELPFTAIVRAFVEGSERARDQERRRSLATHEALSVAATGGGGLADVVAALRTRLQHDVWVLEGPTQAWCSGPEPELGDLASVWRQAAGAPAYPAQAERADGSSVSVFPVPSGGPPPSYLVYLQPVGSLADADRMTLRQSVRYVGSELSRYQRSRAEAGQRARELLELLEEDRLTLAEAAHRLGQPPIVPQVWPRVLVLGYEAVPLALAEGLIDASREVLKRNGRQGLVVPKADETVVVCWVAAGESDATRESDRALLARLHAVAHRQLAQRVWAGSAIDSGDLTLAVSRARRAAAYARRLEAGPPVANYEDLGSYHILFALDASVAASFQDLVLGPVRAYDEHRGSDLVRTLDVFLEANGQLKPAAAALCIHVNTLRYRLRSIERLTGRALASAADRVDFYLALRMTSKDRPLTGPDHRRAGSVTDR